MFSTTKTSRKKHQGWRVAAYLGLLTAFFLLAALIWTVWVVHRINQAGSEDRAQPADAIAVFGAAEYAGKPSPVYHARLDHALALYDRQIAPRIITLGGGSDKDSGKTEGGVGRDYLLANGVPYADIIAETHSFTTAQQVNRLAEIARAHHLSRVVVVSDSTHLLRIQTLCAQAGLKVFLSPRPTFGTISDYDLFWRYAHEILSYTALRLGLNETLLHSWLESKPED